jgi:hypothetical protein
MITTFLINDYLKAMIKGLPYLLIDYAKIMVKDTAVLL